MPKARSSCRSPPFMPRHACPATHAPHMHAPPRMPCHACPAMQALPCMPHHVCPAMHAPPCMPCHACPTTHAFVQAERACDPKRSMELYTQLVELHPTAEMYARLSKQYTDMMYLPGTSSQQVVELNSKAVDTAKQAVGLDAGCPLAHIALCVSRGRLALVSDNRTKVQLARDAADDAAEALRLDPHSDLAHHLMGRWHFEMAQLGPFARYLIKILFGTSLMNGSFPEALEHYRTARELNPERLIHRVEVGRLLMKVWTGPFEHAAAGSPHMAHTRVSHTRGPHSCDPHTWPTCACAAGLFPVRTSPVRASTAHG